MHSTCTGIGTWRLRTGTGTGSWRLSTGTCTGTWTTGTGTGTGTGTCLLSTWYKQDWRIVLYCIVLKGDNYNSRFIERVKSTLHARLETQSYMSVPRRGSTSGDRLATSRVSADEV